MRFKIMLHQSTDVEKFAHNCPKIDRFPAACYDCPMMKKSAHTELMKFYSYIWGAERPEQIVCALDQRLT